MLVMHIDTYFFSIRYQTQKSSLRNVISSSTLSHIISGECYYFLMGLLQIILIVDTFPMLAYYLKIVLKPDLSHQFLIKADYFENIF